MFAPIVGRQVRTGVTTVVVVTLAPLGQAGVKVGFEGRLTVVVLFLVEVGWSDLRGTPKSQFIPA